MTVITSRMAAAAAAWLVASLAVGPAEGWAQSQRQTHAATTPLLSSDGGRYVGAVRNGKFHGQGRLTWPDGSFYEGGFVDGRFAGQGRFQRPGYTYQGEFRDGVQSGEGTLEQRAGTSKGTFRNGMLNGRGEFSRADGQRYVGEFKDHVFHGQGRFTGRFGEVYEGAFVDGEFTGRGTMQAPNGYRFEGQFVAWAPKGMGRATDVQGTVYEGVFGDGGLQGIGSITWADGTRYNGDVQGWVPHGKGVLKQANGDVYEGNLVQGFFDGEGTLTYAQPKDGVAREQGAWSYGQLKAKADAEQREARAAAETALYAQPALLDRALASLRAPDAGRINLYFLGVAGDGSQEVFRREVAYVRAQFDERFGTRGRSLTLVNSRATPDREPMATVSSVRRAVDKIAATMNRDEDILFLFLTSHGSKDHQFSLGLRGVDLPPLAAADLGAILKASRIRWKVVVVSACYAGGFIEPLQDEGTLVITAARHDRQSFGCADENDFTYFGRAYFKESLPASVSFEAAFAAADKLVGEWETRDQQKLQSASRRPAVAVARNDGAATAKPEDYRSLPQMAAPAPIARQLERWWAQTVRP